MEKITRAAIRRISLGNVENKIMKLLIPATSFHLFRISSLIVYPLLVILLALTLSGCVSKEPVVISVVEPVPAPAPYDEDLRNEIGNFESARKSHVN